MGPRSAVVVIVVAMTIAGVPALWSALLHPEAKSWWLWLSVVIAATFSLVGAKAWTIEDRLFPVNSILYNGLMTLLMLR
jgi:hypothetical protein